MLDKDVAGYNSCTVVVKKDPSGLVQQSNDKLGIDGSKKCWEDRSRIVCCIIIVLCLLGVIALTNGILIIIWKDTHQFLHKL